MLGIKHTLFHQYIDISAGYNYYVYVMYWFLECHFQNSYLLFHLFWQLKQRFVRAFAVHVVVYNYDVKVENYTSILHPFCQDFCIYRAPPIPLI